MGSSQSIETTISTEVEAFVKQTNEQYIKLFNSTSTSVITKASNKQKAAIENDNSAFNIITLSNSTFINSKINLDQRIELMTTSNALLSLTQNTTLLNNISNDSKTQIKQAITADQKLSTDLKLVADITKKKETKGEFNNFISSVKDMVNSLLGQNVKDTTTIRNRVKQSLITVNVESTDISNIVNNTFATDIEINTINSCTSKNTSGNTISMNGITMIGSDLNAVQKVYAKQISNCIISSIISNNYTELLKNLQETEAAQDAKSSQSGIASLVSSVVMTISDIASSFLDIIANNITLIIMVIVVLVAIGLMVFGLPIIKGMFNKKNMVPAAPINYNNK